MDLTLGRHGNFLVDLTLSEQGISWWISIVVSIIALLSPKATFLS